MTIAGAHTVAELIDLVKAKDYVIGEMQNGYDSFQDTWKATDAPTQSKWLDDWNALKTRYGRAHLLAEVEIANAKIQPLPNDVIPAETAWTSILRALQKIEGVVSPGDLQDLYMRLSNAGKPVPTPRIPQPGKGTDVDLNVVNTLEPFDPIHYVAQNPKKSIAGAIILGGIGFLGYTAIVSAPIRRR